MGNFQTKEEYEQMRAFCEKIKEVNNEQLTGNVLSQKQKEAFLNGAPGHEEYASRASKRHEAKLALYYSNITLSSKRERKR